MSEVKFSLDCQEELEGEDGYYRNNLESEVKEDTEDDTQLSFDIEGKKIFVKKEDLKEIIRIFEI